MMGLGGWRPAWAFTMLYLSYVVAYICRKNYGFWLNGLIQRKDMDATSASVFGSTMELAYGAGKLMAGPVADNAKPKKLLVITLLIAALSNALMFQTGFYSVDVGLWALNGLAQAFIWPALAMIFFYWFGSSPVRGTLYSLLSTNQNVGSAVTPLFLSPFVATYGWRFALWGPAIVGVIFSVFLALFLREKPIEETEKSSSETKKKAEATNKAEDANYMNAVKDMLKDPSIWYLGMGYALLTTVRVGLSDWTLVMLRAHHNITDTTARDCLVALETGGFIGGLAVGVVSDVVFKGRRTPVMVLFTLVLATPGAYLLFFGPTRFLVLSYFLFGFGSFGPHVLVGLLAREIFPSVSSTAGSFAKSLAQVGGAFSGVPISVITSRYGWAYAGYLWVGCCVASAVAFALMVTLEGKSRAKKATKTE